MSNRTPEDPTTPADPEPDPPLTLADSRGGSTMPVAGETASSGSSSAPARTSSGTAAGGVTTGGFETLLGKVVVRSGLATKDEVAFCSSLIEGDQEPHTLADLLVDKGYVTRHQLDRVRQDFEAKKSGQHIPGYKMLKKLGSGAMATVFLARQLSLDRLVAIKILPKKFSGNAQFIERFYKEGRSAAKLNHPNIVGAYDVGRAGEHHFFVMEYVDGSTIHDRIAKERRIREKDSIDIVRQVAKALEHAHERGFIHRDVKPKNVMVTKKGVVKLADLGLARAMSDEEAAKAEAGRAYGTPYYISPEQIRGEVNIAPAADIYGLGATFYHMVTGRVPFEGKNPSEVMHRHLKAPLEPPDHINPDLSAGCAQVIEMMMAKKVQDRYQNCTDLLEDLGLVRRGQPPHFAHRTLDEAVMTDAMTDAVDAPPVIPHHTPERTKGFGRPGLGMLILSIVLIASVLINLILLAIVVA